MEEIIAVMRAAGNGVDGARLRALIVILWRAGLRIGEALDLDGTPSPVTDYLAAQLSPAALRKTATDELISLVPMLRRLPRRLDRISGSLEHRRLSINVRLLADESDHRY